MKKSAQVMQMFGPAQAAVARAVVDSVAEGVIPKDKADEYVIVCGVFIAPSANDNKKIYKNNYEATKLAMNDFEKYRAILPKYTAIKPEQVGIVGNIDPDAYAGAVSRSLLAVSALDGTSDESLLLNTWNNTGFFYIRGQGDNGVWSVTVDAVPPGVVASEKGAWPRLRALASSKGGSGGPWMPCASSIIASAVRTAT